MSAAAHNRLFRLDRSPLYSPAMQPAPGGSARSPSLRRFSRTPAWLSLLLRTGLALALIGVALAVHWFDRDGLRDNTDGSITFVDVLYFTMITVTTVGFGDIVPVTQQARLFDTFVVTPIRLFVWLIFLGTAYDFFFKRAWERWRMSVIQRKLENHVVVVGYGTSGEEAFSELVRRGTNPAQIVVVDTNPHALESAAACGAVVLEADATRNASLEAVRIDKAKAIIVSPGRDDTAVLIVLTARRLAPKVPVSVVIRAEDNQTLAQQAGATTVINPASFAGLLLAGSTYGPNVADYMSDLAAWNGRVALRERPVTADEVGKPLADLATGMGLRIHRNGDCHGFWETQASRLEPGDVVVEIVPNFDPLSEAAA